MVVMRRDEPVERGDSLELTVPTDGRRLPDDPGIVGRCRGERRPVPAETFEIVGECHEGAIAPDPNRLDAESAEVVFLLLDVDGETAVVPEAAGRLVRSS